MKKVKTFLWFCSGVYFPLIKKSPSESNKYAGIGATVLFTGILAALSAGYAFFTIFDSLIPSILFAVLWGLVIFNLDRFIVSSMKKSKALNEWKLAVPRLILAVLLAFVISTPLELKIFEKEINRKLDERRAAAVIETKSRLDEGFPELLQLENSIELLRAEIRKSGAFRDEKQREYDNERFGIKTDGTSGLRGLGVNAEKKEEQLDQAQLEYEETRDRNLAKIGALEDEIRQFRDLKQIAFEKQQPGIDGYDGLAARIDALSSLTKESQAMAWANIFIMLLFVAVETAPIFVKLMADKGPYDEMLARHEEEMSLYNEEMLVKSRQMSAGRLKYFMATKEQQIELSVDRALEINRLKSGYEQSVEEARLGKWKADSLKDLEIG